MKSANTRALRRSRTVHPAPRLPWLLLAIVLAALTLAACGEGDIESLPEAQQQPGIQTNVPVAQVESAGWSVCFSGNYEETSIPLSTIRAQCNSGVLMLACRPFGSDTLTVAAAGLRSDVLMVTPADSTTVHVANGVAWYYNPSHSWGFIEPGDTISKTSCDTATGAFDERRLCWHTGGFGAEPDTLSGGFRCGLATFLNTGSGIGLNWERLIYQL